MFDRLTTVVAVLSGVGLLGLAACQPADIAAPSEPALSIERAFGSPSLNGPSPRSLRFSPDGSRVTFLRAKDEDRTVLDLWAMDIDGGEPYVLVDSQVLAPDERALTEAERQLRERARISASGIVRYQWDSQGEAVLVPLDGDVFHINVASGDARRLMQTPEYETDARVSPQGNFVSFIREQNLYVTDLTTGEERAITSEGGGLISWGMAEFVAQEEFRRSTGYWWSPDERYIALARVDESRVDIIERLEIGSDGSANVIDQRYPRAGTQNAVVELFVFDLENSEMRRVELAETDDFYLARVNWARDSETAYVQVLNRVQNALDIRAVDAATGTSSTWLTETTDIWINLSSDFETLGDGSVLWTSEDTPGGFRHIQHRAADGSLITQVTAGEWVVTGLSAVDIENGLVYFIGWMETPIERHLYVVPLDGSAEPTRITQGHGGWGVRFNHGASAFIGRYSDPATPPQTGLYASDGSRIRWIEENRLDETHPYGEFADAHLVPSYGTLEATDGSILHYTLYKPVNFVPGRQYPAVQYLYGGPGVQIVTRGWQSTRAQLFAQRGYVYFTLDSRGSYNRGREFEGHIQRAMGSVEVDDQLVGLDFLQSLEFVDADNIGMWGWSYGGYMTLMTTLQAPGRYAAGVAGAPVTDWTLYDTAYTERYMDHPDANFEGYQQSSVFAHLDGYETPLLLVHGMADDNVIFANSVRLYAELQEQGSQFEMMTYPGQRHGVRGEARQIHLWTGIFDFFDRHLKDEEE
jgi:dipeptidyl-peptidase-4